MASPEVVGRGPRGSDETHAASGVQRPKGAQRLPLDEGHDVEQEAVRGARVEERQDVRVQQARGGLDLDYEPICAEHGGQFGLESLGATLRSWRRSSAR